MNASKSEKLKNITKIPNGFNKLNLIYIQGNY
jgi:hypothetical protein